MRNGTRQTNNNSVFIIELPCNTDHRGNLTPVESEAIPIEINRVYFVHGISDDITRGDHGHYRTNQVLMAVEGTVTIECYDGVMRRKFTLDSPNKALYVPRGIWTTNYHNKGSVMCVLADRPYDQYDYIEDRSVFKRWKRCQPFFGMFDSFGGAKFPVPPASRPSSSLENNEWLTYQLSELEFDSEPDQELVNVLSNGDVVLDFGGSLGHSYHRLSSTNLDVEYHVVETKTMADAGKKLFENHGNLFFHDSIPDIPVDVVYSRTSLQYVDDWRVVLKQLADLGAKYMVLSDTQAGRIPTFVGIQNWYGHFVPNWFFNLDELLGALMEYDLEMLTVGMDVNMTNYKEEQRLTNACNLILKRHVS